MPEGIWYHTAVDGERVRLVHGPIAVGERGAATFPSRAADWGVGAAVADLRISRASAVELAVGLVHAALELDSGATQAQMLSLFVLDAMADEPAPVDAIAFDRER